jgi:hypothetical protein
MYACDLGKPARLGKLVGGKETVWKVYSGVVISDGLMAGLTWTVRAGWAGRENPGNRTDGKGGRKVLAGTLMAGRGGSATERAGIVGRLRPWRGRDEGIVNPGTVTPGMVTWLGRGGREKRGSWGNWSWGSWTRGSWGNGIDGSGGSVMSGNWGVVTAISYSACELKPLAEASEICARTKRTTASPPILVSAAVLESNASHVIVYSKAGCNRLVTSWASKWICWIGCGRLRLSACWVEIIWSGYIATTSSSIFESCFGWHLVQLRLVHKSDSLV